MEGLVRENAVAGLIDIVKLVDYLLQFSGISDEPEVKYTNDLQDLQMIFSDEMIEQVIEPFLSTQGKEAGIDYSNIYLVFPVLTTESNADTSIWLFPAVRM